MKFLLLAAFGTSLAFAQVPEFRDLFNGKDLKGWVNVNTAEDTWRVQNGILICKGQPVGVMRTDRQYENFILHIEWKHTQPGGNSGVFVWSTAIPSEKNRLPDGIEAQILELDFPKLNVKDGVPAPHAAVTGELFGMNGVKIVPDTARGEKSTSTESRCKGKGEWNSYDIVAVDGVIKMAVNGKFVNGLAKATQRAGYICLESEGAEIHFRNIRILELPPGSAMPVQMTSR